jgi:mRNA-degrading endonuclease RelE of RelBE toxin-antitoxin system
MATVLITAEAQEEFDALPRIVQGRLLGVFERLEKWPAVSGAKLLRGDLFGSRRIRSGDYRVLFRLTDDDTVLIWKIAHRGSGLYD